MEKKKLTQKEKEFNDYIINSTLGDLAHEGYVDKDNKLRNLLQEIHDGKITHDEAVKNIINGKI